MVDMMHWYCGQIIHCKTYPAHDPVYEDLEEGLLSERVAAAAETCLRVTPHFYRHQAVGLRAALLGHDVVVATPTASGACDQPVSFYFFMNHASNLLHLQANRAFSFCQFFSLYFVW
jgi:hypothetical protein